MSRKIAFRAWDGEEMYQINSAMFDNHKMSCLFEHGNTLEGKPTSHIIDSVLAKGPIIVMQFTGLLDAKGKDIYEGDILRHRFEEWEDWDTYKVIYSDAAFIAHDTKSSHWLTLGKHNGFEVIGNVYENPNLLET